MKTLNLTENQAEHLRNRCDARLETVEGDPESGDAFELTPGALAALQGKLLAGTVILTAEEAEWVSGEAANLLDIANANHAHPEWDGERRSMANLCAKL